MAEQDNRTFEHIFTLTASFEEPIDKGNRVVSLEELIVEIETLPVDEQQLILGLVRTKMKANRLEYI